jgi:hypothetical protein
MERGRRREAHEPRELDVRAIRVCLKLSQELNIN